MKLNEIDWDSIINQKPKDIPKPIIWKENDIKDIFGEILRKGDRILKACEVKYPDYKAFKKGIIKKIDLTKRENPIGVLLDENKRIGWTSFHRILSSRSLPGKI